MEEKKEGSKNREEKRKGRGDVGGSEGKQSKGIVVSCPHHHHCYALGGDGGGSLHPPNPTTSIL